MLAFMAENGYAGCQKQVLKGGIDGTVAGPGRGQPWVAAGFNLRIAKPPRPCNPDGVDPTSVRPLQGRNDLAASLSVGFTYGYSRYAASRHWRCGD